ncbi:ATP-binding protein [Zavarzinia sp. CC-PAN008]|uniref:ATP-binding protein n=1 Tax=Zavarzinia sp. CC-PAN008 TaxID=3243332 RepID=UPI003F747326
MKRVLPRSLFARTLIIIVAPLLLSQATLAYVFVERHWETVTRRLCRGVAGDIAYLAEFASTAPGAENGQLINLARRHMQFEVAVIPGEPLPATTRADYPILDRVLRQELAAHVGLPFTLDTERYPGFIDMHFQLGGAVMRVLAPLSRVSSHTTTLFFLWMVGASLLFVGVAIIFLRNQVRPIRRLALAAAAFGKGQPIDFKPTGADEVRLAASEFLAMRERIERHVRQRTEMLAGISHDLRTPLTRMRLELAMLPPSEEVNGLAADVREMENMVAEFLAFTRGANGETPSPVDLRDLMDEVAADAALREDARPVAVDCAPGLVVATRRQALKRALVNLVNNALRYGTRVRLSAFQVRHAVTILVDDDGPGIPPDQREAAFRPFVRLDEARNLDHGGGVGLGLAITRDLVRAQGGEVELESSPMGGLRVRLRLPM